MSAEQRYERYARVRLKREVKGWGRTFKPGRTGHIVEVHGDHEAYEVELDPPTHVVTVKPQEIAQQ